MVRPEKRAKDKRVMAYAGAIMFTVLGIFVAALVLDSLYSPYEFVRYTAAPPSACPGDSITVRVERKIEPRPGFTVRDIEAKEVLWINRDTGQTVPVPPPSPQPISDSEQRKNEVVDSVLVTDTPVRPGAYTLYTELKVSGRALIFGADQNVKVRTDDVLRILPNDDPECGEG